jgi:hypothetical protein
MIWMIEAGMPGNVNPESGEWLFIDVGFAQTGNKSCGLLSDAEPHARALTGGNRCLCNRKGRALRVGATAPP